MRKLEWPNHHINAVIFLFPPVKLLSLFCSVQTQYFGLRYVDRRIQYQWVDLDKPLKKQLDKHAESQMLYFSLMFHVTDGLVIQDSIALYVFNHSKHTK